MVNAPIVWEIDSDPVLAGTKLIAEAWDSGALYQVGSFGQDKWKEWNGAFRDNIRSFIKGDAGSVWRLREGFTGSPDIYTMGERPAGQSINYVTCHDGFTLKDLVSYDSKHNEGNRDGNSSGTDANFSWNCGVEGPAIDKEIQRLRTQQMKNFVALTLLSVGIPMLMMGDEVRRTQGGNNNAYCLNGATSWFDWNLCSKDPDLLRFVQCMIRVRLSFNHGTTGIPIALEDYLDRANVEWHGTALGKPDWGWDSHSLALAIHNYALDQVRYIAINSYWQPLRFELPPLATSRSSWVRVLDTSLLSPEDIAAVGEGAAVSASEYVVNARSIVMLHHSEGARGSTP